MTGELDGRTALVTGAATGIGRAIVLRLLAAGADLVAVDRDAAGLADLQRVGGARVMTAILDVTDEPAVENLFQALHRARRLVTVLVNNAAARTPSHDVVTLPLANWHEALAVNLTAAFLFSRHAVPMMRTAGRGSVIHVASQLGGVSTAGRACYSATKGALIMLAKGMALDHAGENIRVNSLSPGAVMTERLTSRFGSTEAVEAHFVPLHPMGRVGRADEIAEAALFLASDRSSFMTGADLLVDGGYTAR